MTAAVDSNILLDLLTPDPEFVDASQALLQEFGDQHRLVIAPEVYAELAPQAGSIPHLDEILDGMSIVVLPTNLAVARLAGAAWKQYHLRGGKKGRVINDFFIGAHAQVHADCLLTRDRGFFRRYFRDLKVIMPAASRRDAEEGPEAR